MQSDPSSAWPSAVATAGDDFANFLEYDLDLDFQAFDGQTPAQTSQDASTQNSAKQSYDTTEYYDQMRHTSIPKTGSTGDLRDRMTGLQMRPNTHPAQHGYSQPIQYQSRIPPTPSSSDLHGGHPQLLVDSQQAAIYEAHVRKQQEQMAFTPLGTPAVTPMDTNFQIRDFTVSGEYFSPLASPALHAQNRHSDGGIYYPFQMSDASETTSPVDISFDPTLKPTSAPRKQQKKRSPASTSKASPRTVRQSPAMKAQRKKGSSTVIPAKEVHDVLTASRPGTASGSQSLGLPPTNVSSESPEPLLDMMPPPAIPSTSRSPFIPPESRSAPARPNAPATPTSLLKMQNVGPMQDLNLGAAALDTEDVAMADAPTPTISAIPSTGFTASSAMSPPSTTLTPKLKGKAEFKAPLKSKKRNSSSQASPALRPKISPSIKPLLPEGILNAETSALFLASKSNYQNIIDGTHLPGVTYPEALSENLTSKRTSHKIAEQGRRNRINTALQEIAALLPQGSNGNVESTGTAQSSSKASTVEQAIDYIKLLQAELKDTHAKLAFSENKLKEVEAANGSGSSAGVTPGDTGEQANRTEGTS